jgi:hypothetical protein
VRRQSRKSGLLIGEINGEPAREHMLGYFLQDAGFVETAQGFQMRRITPIMPIASEAASSDEAEPDDESVETA